MTHANIIVIIIATITDLTTLEPAGVHLDIICVPILVHKLIMMVKEIKNRKSIVWDTPFLVVFCILMSIEDQIKQI